MKLTALSLIDFYKSGHYQQYLEGTDLIYSDFTPRSAEYFPIPNIDKVLFFGLQGPLQWLLCDLWEETFFFLPEEYVIGEYMLRMDSSLSKGVITPDHIIALHRLGYLPVEIKALPEGSLVPLKVPL